MRSALGHNQTHAPQQKAPLLNDLVGPLKERLRDRQAKRFRGLEVDDQFDFGWQLDRQIARLRASQDEIDV
jgi:hypothetical protein